MSAQDFHGVTVGGPVNWPTIINQSSKSVMGYALQCNTTTGSYPVFSFVDLGSLAAGKPIQPGEERPIGRFNVPRVGSVTAYKGETIGYELNAVLFTDGTYYGPERIFLNFSEHVYTVRSLARDALYAQDKYDILSRERSRMWMSMEDTLKAMRDPSPDSRKLDLRSNMATIFLEIRDNKGELEAEAALARIASLPDVQKGEQNCLPWLPA